MNIIDPLELGRQLRKPSGSLAKSVAENMNTANTAIYVFGCTMLDFKDGERILEIGFGNGMFFSKYFEKNKNIKLYGIDHSEEMCSEALKLNSTYVDKGSLTVVYGDASKTLFDNDFFDTIITINTIYFWNSVEQQLAEVRRILKSGGTFLIGFRPKSNMENIPFTKGNFSLFESAEVLQLLENNGFRVVNHKENIISRKSVDNRDITSIDICVVAQKC